ncbi:MAG: hypothetical protein CUN55_10390 [Phototrophicales bacterium]|nr:MAG: hypothetical protein CUN55_10390 [Phototrophicales bacterium]
MTEKKSPPSPNVPHIQKCPRCGNPILIGDRRCTRCGHNVDTFEKALRRQDPMLVAGVAALLGIGVTLGALEMEALPQLITLIIGAGLILGGGVFFGISIIFLDGKRRRK